ncbi:coagulation factor 5/8 type domain-containing protein [Segetibacter sp. 3557_3]|uniref:coagulation factor 5/8 type domain-containing protein n=1 Tax=Segetibacter sp. 3557_3 TaxID=2547429 RepID=UPI0010583B7A|nr:coagulation factor 5/8 type domain-containing protein [Segetibacter sp. 3557_3]TDH28625.1 coagulation factor 5/8 type domain-containing protein [Segetibacter sp. 3557_3]
MNLLYLLALTLLTSCTKKGELDPIPFVQPNTNIVRVATAAELKSALLVAKPGDEIILADGLYSGRFVIPAGVNGTSSSPIILRGSRQAILDGGSTSTGYVLHVQSSYWVVKGFTVKNGLKGIMADGVNHSLFDSLYITNVGEEALHIRKFSSFNTIQHCEITYAGLKTPDYGEGVYIGTAKSNWATVTNGEIDRCDSNKILNNKIGPFIAAECIDIKEGTTGGLIRGNTFDSQGIQGANSADSWIDVKGNNYLIEDNIGNNAQPSALLDGYQVNVAYNGWGNNNEFKANTCNVHAAGHGINVRLSSSSGTATGNKVYTSNQVNGAAKGISNIPLTN